MLLEQYGETVAPPRTGKPGRPRKTYKQWPDNAAYATVNKTYRKGKVAAVDRKLVHGTEEDLAAALTASACSDKINTAFVERQNGTDRSYNARKADFPHVSVGVSSELARPLRDRRPPNSR